MAQDNYTSRKKLYDALSTEFDLGDEQTFMKKMDSPESRRKLYDAVSDKFDLGDYDTFESKVGNAVAVGQQADAAMQQVQQNADATDRGQMDDGTGDAMQAPAGYASGTVAEGPVEEAS